MKLKIIILGLIIMAFHTSSSAVDKPHQLQPCPDSPNCVSSQALKPGHLIAPFKIKGEPDAAFQALKMMLAGQSRVKITQASDNTLHAEVTSALFRFVDDVDAILDAEAGVIHIRSASRIGYSDLGVNRKRVEALRAQLQLAGWVE